MTNKEISENADIIRYNLVRLYDELKKTNNAKKFMSLVGVYDTTISYWRRGITTPQYSTIKRICDNLGVDLRLFCTKKINVKLTYNLDINFD